jgi:SEC-C motif
MSDSDYEMRLKATGRNDRCPCGSGKKYKKCHLAEDEAARTATLKALEEEAMARAKAAKAAKAAEDGEGQADTKGADTGTGSTRRPNEQFGSKGRASDGKPKNIPRRGAV